MMAPGQMQAFLPQAVYAQNMTGYAPVNASGTDQLHFLNFQLLLHTINAEFPVRKMTREDSATLQLSSYYLSVKLRTKTNLNSGFSGFGLIFTNPSTKSLMKQTVNKVNE